MATPEAKGFFGELAKYGLVGAVQLLLDWIAFVLMTWFGVPVIRANIIARIGAAMLGFWLNGKYTFSNYPGSKQLGRDQMVRFILSWSVLTILSSAVVWFVGQRAGLTWAWVVKPAADAVFALLGFFISRQWIYR